VLSDTHCHLDFPKFDSDRADVIARAQAAGVDRILIPGIDVESSQRAISVAETQPILFAAIGVHPTEAGNVQTFERVNALRKLANLHFNPSPDGSGTKGEGKVKAIGEIGLDYYWNSAPHDVQQKVLIDQLNLAGELNLPVVIHMREKGDAEDGDCAADLINILEDWATRLQRDRSPLVDRPGVLHSFSGSITTAHRAIALGFYIGITGPITYKNAESKREVVRSLPLEKILIETDAPYLAPVPQRGKRNEPAFVSHIADKIAEVKHINREQVCEATSANADRLFAWRGSF
jgi:TatD DNase family protein